MTKKVIIFKPSRMQLLGSCQDHITPVLRHLHWLPVRQRIKYKLAMTVYKCLHRLEPIYLADESLLLPVRDTFGPRSHRVTIRTKDKDHPRNEEFRGRRPSHLEQFANRSANRNSHLADVRSTSEGPAFWLIDSASEDYDALYKSTHHHHHHLG